ncbi:Endonuclease/exonuclease/phosphatase, partial [Cerioporus squamosus]
MLINQLLRQNRIAVLALQEAHLTVAQADRLNTIFAGLMKVYASPDPDSPTAARGVAFAANLHIVREDKMSVCDLIPGRAMSLTLTRRRGTRLSFMNVYAPNVMVDNMSFWTQLQAMARAPGWPKPDVLLGDLNVVEDTADRAPFRADHKGAVASLRVFLSRCELIDGWRARNGSSRQFSYLQTSTGSQSRIDRIYVSHTILKMSHSWEIDPPGVPTDHCMVSVSLADYNEPAAGPGRWRLPDCLLSDKTFLDEAQKLGSAAMALSFTTRPDRRRCAAQWRLHEFKADIIKYARSRAKQLTSKLDKKIKAIKEDI